MQNQSTVEKATRVVEAQEFILRDDKGRERAALRMLDDGPALIMKDADGHQRLRMRVRENKPDSPYAAMSFLGNDREQRLCLFAGDHESEISISDDEERKRIRLNVGIDGRPSLLLCDRRKTARVSLEVDQYGEGTVAIEDEICERVAVLSGKNGNASQPPAPEDADHGDTNDSADAPEPTLRDLNVSECNIHLQEGMKILANFNGASEECILKSMSYEGCFVRWLSGEHEGQVSGVCWSDVLVTPVDPCRDWQDEDDEDDLDGLSDPEQGCADDEAKSTHSPEEELLSRTRKEAHELVDKSEVGPLTYICSSLRNDIRDRDAMYSRFKAEMADRPELQAVPAVEGGGV